MTDRDMRQQRRLRIAFAPLAVVAAGLLAGCSGPDNQQNSLHANGRSAHKIVDLFKYPFWLAVFIGIAVIFATVFIAWRFRERPGNENPKQIHGNTVLEIVWTAIPALILIVLSVPTIALIFDLAKEPKSDALNVTVVGKQWWWEFKYPDQKIATANEFHIPAGRPVRLEMTACDPTIGSREAECNVIHSFWIPELAGKQDLVPGRTTKLVLEADKDAAGKTFLGQCAQYCGLSHARMRMRVIVDTPEDFERWVQEQQVPAEPLTDEDGEPTGDVQTLLASTFGCANCHAVDDPSKTSYGPNLSHLGSRETFASGAYPLNKANLKRWVLDAPSMVPMEAKGCPATQKPGCVGMPSFTKHLPKGMQKMTDAEADQIADYLLAQK